MNTRPLETASLAQIGSYFLDVYDEAMAMNATRTDIYYIATAKATRTRTLLNEPIGTEISVVVVLNECSSPSWAELCGTHFETAEEARNAACQCSGSMWGFNDVRDIKIKQITETLTREIVDVDD